jgi:hypothetical protein
MNSSEIHPLILLLGSLMENESIKSLSEKLNVASGTIIRWLELNDIPQQYEFDLMKLANIPIDYSLYSSKQKDQFFTPSHVANKCYEIMCNEILKYEENMEEFVFIEPSAGDGSFTKILPKNSISMDIEPRYSSIIKQDYLEWKPPINLNNVKYIVIGNPPFGLRGHLALKFINHSALFADYVCFILPQLFESD